MTATLHPACPLCGLRFGSRPLLDLHIREDHRQRGHRGPGDAQIPATRSGSASHRHKPAAMPLRTPKEVTAMTAAHRPSAGRIVPTPGRVIHALRHVSNELTRAFEAMIRSARAPQPRLRVQPTAAESRDTAAERAGQAA